MAQEAADSGKIVEAQVFVAKMYASGFGRKHPSYEKAAAYLELAKAKGSQEASLLLTRWKREIESERGDLLSIVNFCSVLQVMGCGATQACLYSASADA